MASRTVIQRDQDPSTHEWMDANIRSVRLRIAQVDIDCVPLVNIVHDMKEHRIWDRYLRDEPKTWERFWDVAIGEFSSEFVDRIVAAVDDLEAAGDKGPKSLKDLPELGGHGGARKSEQRDQVDNVNLPAGGGNNSTYLARRIKRDSPAIFAELEAGTYPSVRQAAIAAGIVRVPTPLDELRRAWRKATAKQRETFLSELFD